MRLPLNWPAIEADNPEYFPPDWSGFDREVELAAEAGIRVMPTVWGSPDWVAAEAHGPAGADRLAAARLDAVPARSGAALRAATVEFWEQHPDLPYLPIRRWEIWNEENIVSFADRTRTRSNSRGWCGSRDGPCTPPTSAPR